MPQPIYMPGRQPTAASRTFSQLLPMLMQRQWQQQQAQRAAEARKAEITGREEFETELQKRGQRFQIKKGRIVAAGKRRLALDKEKKAQERLKEWTPEPIIAGKGKDARVYGFKDFKGGIKLLPKPIGPKRVWDNKQKRYVWVPATDVFKEQYGKTQEQILEEKKATATTINILGEREKRAKEIHGIKIEKTLGQQRSELLSNRSKKDYYDTWGVDYNVRNKKGEVAYWEPGKYWGGETKIIKIPKRANTTGEELQAKAATFGVPLRKILKDLGIID